MRFSFHLQMLYAILDDFRADSDDFEALASYYEHHYRRRYGKIVDLEHFLIMYMVDPRVTDKRNIRDYLAMIHFMEQLEELERQHRVLCTERLLTPVSIIIIIIGEVIIHYVSL
ncbi:hypothetical protein XENTR_v10000450 [Xenopus tropicalis]|nr:hypothetical protein XENTR_v10000450 [Xenopus tropicalis]